MRVNRCLIGATVTLLCAACAAAPERVRALASRDISCNSSQVMVTRTQRGDYIRDDRYEAQGCGQKAAYECERAYVLLIPVGSLWCRKV